MIRLTIAFCLPLAFCAGETNAIHGTILDPSSRPIEGAAVSCQDRTAYSNFEGRFSFAGVDKCEAKVEKSGFTTGSFELSDSAENRINLPVAGPLETVVVSATRTETTPEQAAVAANVITEQQLTALNYPALFEVFRDLPGLQVSQSGRRGALAEVYTRGAERTGTLVLL